MPKMFSPSTMFLEKKFCPWKHEKPASKVAEPAQIQPKSQFLFHKNLPPHDFSIMTLSVIMLRLTSLWSILCIEFTKSLVQELNKNCRLWQSWNPQPPQVSICLQFNPPKNSQCSLWTALKSKLFLFLNSFHKILLKSGFKYGKWYALLYLKILKTELSTSYSRNHSKI